MLLIVSPLDYRYGRDNAKEIFTEAYRVKSMLEVESASSIALAAHGKIPREASADIVRACRGNHVQLQRIKELEKETQHDIMALTRAISEQVSAGKPYVHFGLTSNDVNDTALSLQIKAFSRIMAEDLLLVMAELEELIRKYSGSVMLGRTHGQHASPITFGLKMAVFLGEFTRHAERFLDGMPRVLVGKMLGPVGTGATIGADALEVQEEFVSYLGLGSEINPSQVTGRDRLIEYLSVINNISVSTEKLSTEIRNLQRPEIGEVSEYFETEKQVGSSSMPSKMNPVTSENITSLSRLIRSFIIPQYEGSIMWHERDLTNSALERFTIPYSSILIDYVLAKLQDVLSRLAINEQRMKKNLNSSYLAMSESLVLMLVNHGIPRLEAHELVRRASVSTSERSELVAAIVKSASSHGVSEKDVETSLEASSFLGATANICKSTLEKSVMTRKRLSEYAGRKD